MHGNKYLWRLHEAHHSPKKVDWLSGSRSHAFEILINQTVEFLPIVLLGSPPEVAAYKGVISAVWGMYIHANLGINTGLDAENHKRPRDAQDSSYDRQREKQKFFY